MKVSGYVQKNSTTIGIVQWA